MFLAHIYKNITRTQRNLLAGNFKEMKRNKKAAFAYLQTCAMQFFSLFSVSHKYQIMLIHKIAFE